MVDLPQLPVNTIHNPVTGKTRITEPTEIYGVDNALETLESVLGVTQAFQVNINAGIAAGGGTSRTFLQIAEFTQGVDKGGVFAYSSDVPSPTVGLIAGVGAEVGAVFAAPSTRGNFNRYSLTGSSIYISGGTGPISGTASMGVKSFWNPVPTSFFVSVGGGPSAFKVGDAASFTNTIF